MTTQSEAIKSLKKELFYESTNVWNKIDAETKAKVFSFCSDYAISLDTGKTEREFYNYSVAELKKAGFVELSEASPAHVGQCVYLNIHNKALVAARLGQTTDSSGFNILGAHIDSPRIDLKQVPFYEDGEMALLKTHYYGGIKKYQWAALPLAMHGVVIKKDGTTVEINIGEKDSDPVFCITDLLPHLGKEQRARTSNETLRGEELNVVIGSMPFATNEEENDLIKLGVADLLHKTYGITARDFITAEIEMVPAQKARDVGLDRALIGAYGQDDRVCAFASLRALLDSTTADRTSVVMLFDKEETGSCGNTGARSKLYLFALERLLVHILGREPRLTERFDFIEDCCLLSSDVSNAFDPTFAAVSDPLNNSYLSRGIAISKYTGHGGKNETSDASAEFYHAVTNILDDAGVYWQPSEMGKVDEGGGGTIAADQSHLGLQVIDCGVPVLSMHSCFEVTSKIDIYESYRAYKAFLLNMKTQK